MCAFLEESFNFFRCFLFLKLQEFFSAHSVHNGIPKFTREWNINKSRGILDLGCHHISWDGVHVYLATVLASVTSCIFLNFLSAIGATVVDHLVVVVDTLDETGDFVEFSFIWLIIVGPCAALLVAFRVCSFDNLLYQLIVIRSVPVLLILSAHR